MIKSKDRFLADHARMWLDAPRIAADLHAQGHHHTDEDIIARTAERQIIACLRFQGHIVGNAFIEPGCREHGVVHVCQAKNGEVRYWSVDRDGLVEKL